MTKRIVIVGHSHLNALRGGARLVHGMDGDLFELDFVQIHAIQQGQTIFGKPPFMMDPHLEAAMEEHLVDCDALVCLAYGKEHNNLGLLNHPRQFDFVLREDPELFLNPDRELVPGALVEAQLRFQTVKLRSLLGKLYDMAPEGIPVFQIECPPPIPSEKHILKYPGPYKKSIDELGVTPKEIRFKMWRVFCRLAREYCQEIGIKYVPAPLSTLDEQGFLAEEAWNPDPTHGNALYGKTILENFVYNVLKLERAK